MNENSCHRETFESGKAKAAAFEKELWAIAREVADEAEYMQAIASDLRMQLLKLRSVYHPKM